MSELRKNIENYIEKCQKEIDRIENAIIEDPSKVYTNAKMQDRAIILEKVKIDLTAFLKEEQSEDDQSSNA